MDGGCSGPATVRAALVRYVIDYSLRVELSDGRALTMPLAWFPRLAQATPEDRHNYRLIVRVGDPLGEPRRGLQRRRAAVS